jgi:hypothetical protein
MTSRVEFDIALISADVASRGWSVHDLVAEIRRVAKKDGKRPPAHETVYRFFRGTHQTARTAKFIARALGRSLDRYIRAGSLVGAGQ